jgi:hypothetical protein
MIIRATLVAAAMAVAALTTTGCAVSRGQETTGAYIDDSTITATVKSSPFTTSPPAHNQTRKADNLLATKPDSSICCRQT